MGRETRRAGTRRDTRKEGAPGPRGTARPRGRAAPGAARPGALPRARALALALALAAASLALLLSCVPAGDGGGERAGLPPIPESGPAGGGPGAAAPPAAAPAGGGGPKAAPGEGEYLRGDLAGAYPRLIWAYAGGDLRAAYFLRIIFQYGLNGQPPNQAEADRAERAMALRAHEIQALSGSAPAHLRGLYHAAIAQLAYHSLIPGSGGDLRLALGRSKTASSDGFTPAMNLYAHIACLEDDSGILGFLKPDKGDCFETTLRAAEAKDILAMGNLSYLYREGVGTARNPMMAASWAHLAANRAPPLPRAQNDMGYYYETGVPVSRDLTEAKRYYGLARGSYPLAQANLDRLSGKGGGGPLVAATVDF